MKLPKMFEGSNEEEMRKVYERIMSEEPPKSNSQASPANAPNLDGFIYVPTVNLYVAREKSFLGENWFDCHKGLLGENSRMLTIPEFVEFLKYTKVNHKDIYDDITEVKSPWRAEWLDADFKVKGEQLYVNYNHILDSSGNLIPKDSDALADDTLMTSRTPGISLEDYLDNHTPQGLPKSDVKEGKLYYYAPMKDNKSVARFDADSGGAFLSCYRGPSGAISDLGVRAVRRL